MNAVLMFDANFKIHQNQCGQQDNEGNTALICAATVGNEEAVQYLKKFELKMANNNKFTALMMAAQKRHPKCVRLLLEE